MLPVTPTMIRFIENDTRRGRLRESSETKLIILSSEGKVGERKTGERLRGETHHLIILRKGRREKDRREIRREKKTRVSVGEI